MLHGKNTSTVTAKSSLLLHIWCDSKKCLLSWLIFQTLLENHSKLILKWSKSIPSKTISILIKFFAVDITINILYRDIKFAVPAKIFFPCCTCKSYWLIYENSLLIVLNSLIRRGKWSLYLLNFYSNVRRILILNTL